MIYDDVYKVFQQKYSHWKQKKHRTLSNDNNNIKETIKYKIQFKFVTMYVGGMVWLCLDFFFILLFCLLYCVLWLSVAQKPFFCILNHAKEIIWMFFNMLDFNKIVGNRFLRPYEIMSLFKISLKRSHVCQSEKQHRKNANTVKCSNYIIVIRVKKCVFVFFFQWAFDT